MTIQINNNSYAKTYGKYDEVEEVLRRRTRLKPASIEIYAQVLRRLCKDVNVEDPFKLVELGLELIEDLTEEWIRRHEHQLAPKHLNLVYCAVKTWCKTTRLIKSRRLFREIDFDKSSRKTEALMETMISTSQVKKIFDMTDIDDKIDMGLYALCGLRPTLIPQLKVKHFHERSVHIEDGKLVIDRRPALLIITRLDDESKPRCGNKGNISFFVFIPTKICELIEIRLNSLGEVTPETRISEAHTYDAMYYKVRRLFRKIGFEGRPYLLRSYGDRIHERITREFNDEDFKEFLMGHKGKISMIYQIKGLTEEDEKTYRDMYVKECDSFINEQIFGTVTKEQKTVAQALGAFTAQQGVNLEKIEAVMKTLESGKTTFEQFNAQLTRLAKEAQEVKMEQRFAKLFAREYAKHNNHK